MSRPLVTVRTLVSQLRERGAIELPENALVTPAARDWLHGSRARVQRVAARRPAPPASPTVYLVGDAAQPVVRALLPALERRWPGLRFLPCHGNMAGLMAALREACARLAESSEHRAVVIVRDGAGVSCVANKCAHVRAAILGAPSALFALQHELGINLLILERERTSLAQMRAAIETFLTGRSSLSPVLAAALDGLAAGVAPAAPAASPPTPAGASDRPAGAAGAGWAPAACGCGG